MKRLTASIFAVLVGLVSINGANAAVTSEAWVKQELAKKQDLLDNENAGTNVTISSDHKINVETTDTAAANSIVPASAGLVHTVMTDAKNARDALDTRIGANETAISNLQSDKADKGTTLADYGIENAYTKGEIDTKIAEELQDSILSGDVSIALGNYLKKTEAEGLYETIAAAQATNNAQTTKIDANTAAVATLNGNESVDGSVAKKIADAVKVMTLVDAAKNGEFVTLVSQENGKISVERRSLQQSDIPTIKLSQVGIDTGSDWRTLMDMLSASSMGSVQLLSTADGLQNLVIRAGAVTTSMIADSAVTTDKLANGAVTADKLGNGAVTGDKLGDSSVTKDKIGAGAVDATKLAQAVQNQLNGALQAPESYAATTSGTLVLTATPQGDGTYTYSWEDISR